MKNPIGRFNVIKSTHTLETSLMSASELPMS